MIDTAAIRARFKDRPEPGSKVWLDDRTYVVATDEVPETIRLCDALDAERARAEQAEAAVARVRALCDDDTLCLAAGMHGDEADCPATLVRAALDGPTP